MATFSSAVWRFRSFFTCLSVYLNGGTLSPFPTEAGHPEKAIVLSVDEKSQIQALDRTQPILPLRPGLPERQTHDYQRHGTTTLFAALNVLEGTVIGECLPRHRHQEFLRFLDRIDQSMESDLDIHLVLDNYGTHTHPAVKKWLAA